MQAPKFIADSPAQVTGPFLVREDSDINLDGTLKAPEPAPFTRLDRFTQAFKWKPLSAVTAGTVLAVVGGLIAGGIITAGMLSGILPAVLFAAGAVYALVGVGGFLIGGGVTAASLRYRSSANDDDIPDTSAYPFANPFPCRVDAEQGNNGLDPNTTKYKIIQPKSKEPVRHNPQSAFDDDDNVTVTLDEVDANTEYQHLTTSRH